MHLKTLVLPRQARDKHRMENDVEKKRCVFCLQGEAEEEAARNTTLGNFICLLNPISWSIYWMIVRRGQKMRDAAKLSAPSGATAAAAAAAAAAVAANKEDGKGEPEEEERWWDEMLAIQIVTTTQRF
jgi:hypothetical protein